MIITTAGQSVIVNNNHGDTNANMTTPSSSVHSRNGDELSPASVPAIAIINHDDASTNDYMTTPSSINIRKSDEHSTTSEPTKVITKHDNPNDMADSSSNSRNKDEHSPTVGPHVISTINNDRSTNDMATTSSTSSRKNDKHSYINTSAASGEMANISNTSTYKETLDFTYKMLITFTTDRELPKAVATANALSTSLIEQYCPDAFPMYSKDLCQPEGKEKESIFDEVSTSADGNHVVACSIPRQPDENSHETTFQTIYLCSNDKKTLDMLHEEAKSSKKCKDLYDNKNHKPFRFHDEANSNYRSRMQRYFNIPKCECKKYTSILQCLVKRQKLEKFAPFSSMTPFSYTNDGQALKLLCKKWKMFNHFEVEFVCKSGDKEFGVAYNFSGSKESNQAKACLVFVHAMDDGAKNEIREAQTVDNFKSIKLQRMEPTEPVL